MKTCSIEDCDGTGKLSKGFCNKHYKRYRTHGDPTVFVSRGATLEEKLRGFTPELPEDVCWPWQSTIGDDGYGQVASAGVTYKAHRVSYARYRGPIPDGQVVRHTCDNPPCVNPSHLILGTPTQNRQDMMDRCRTTAGEKNSGAILTSDDVLMIRKLHADGAPTRVLGGRYRVSHSQIYRIVSMRSWKHI